MERNFAPVITFSFSRKECEAYGMQMAKLDFNTGISRQHWNIGQSNGPPYLQLWNNDGLFPFYAFACRNRNRVMHVMKRNAGCVGPIFWVYLNQSLILDEHATRGEPMILTFMFTQVFSTFAQESHATCIKTFMWRTISIVYKMRWCSQKYNQSVPVCHGTRLGNMLKNVNVARSHVSVI